MVDLLKDVVAVMFDDPKNWIVFAVLVLWFLLARTDSKYAFHIDPRYWVRKLKEEKLPTEETFHKLAVCLVIVVVMFYGMPAIADLATEVSGAPIVDIEDNVIVDVVEFAPLLLLALVTLIPIFEEWMFRGVILDRLATQWSIVGGLIVSSSLFALLHFTNQGYTMWAVLAPLFAGFVLGVVYLKYGLRWSIFTHVVYNAVIWVAVFTS